MHSIFFHNWDIVAKFIGSITAAIIFLWRIFFRKWYKARVAKKKAEEQKKWDDLLNKIKEIRGQVFPNGGGSMNDVQVRMGKQVDEIVLSLNSLKVGQRNFCDILDIASWESDHEGKVTYASMGLCEMLNATPEDIMDNSWVGLIAYFDRDAVVKAWREAVANASDFKMPYSIEVRPGLFQKVIPTVIHNKDKHGRVLNSMGRLLKEGEPYRIK